MSKTVNQKTSFRTINSSSANISALTVTGGNIGINTTSPAFSLDINGFARYKLPTRVVVTDNNTGFTPASVTTSIYAGLTPKFQVNATGINGWNSTTGLYTIPLTGYYNINFYVRVSDNASDVALKPFKILSGTTSPNYYISADNSIWTPTDNANRRCIDYSTIDLLNVGDSIGAYNNIVNTSNPSSILNAQLAIDFIGI